MWHGLLSERMWVTQYHNGTSNGIIEEINKILNIHMCHDLPAERLWVTQFSKVSQWRKE